MKKRLLAMLLAIVIIVGLVAMGIPASAAQSETNTYKVGYAKLDVNPWILYEDSIPSGVSNMTDENGNTIGVPYKEIWAESNYSTRVNTTTVTNGNGEEVTVGIIGTRLAGSGTSSNNYGYSVLDDNADKKVGYGDGLQVTATTVTEDSGKTVVFLTIDSIAGYPAMLNYLKTVLVSAIQKAGGSIDANGIYLNGSHSHSAPDMGNLSVAYANSSNPTYKEDNNPVGAYWKYYRDRVVEAAVTAYNSATPATMSKGSIKVSDVYEYRLNFVRQYTTGKVENGVTLVGGSNFGYHSQKVAEVYEANDTMYLLQFTPTNGGKSTVLVNWRAHGTFIGGSNERYSSDYIGSLRAYMEKAGYNIAFLQGAAGNAVPENVVDTSNEPWKQENNSGFSELNYTNALTNAYNATHYGYLLSKVAQECLSENMSELNAGTIQYQTSDFNYTIQQDTEAQENAALAWGAKVDAEYQKDTTVAWGTISKNLGYTTYPLTLNESGEISNTGAIFNSYYHLYSVYNRAKNRRNSGATTGTISVGAIMLGDQVAMVTCGNELFDRYNANDRIGSIDETKNDWDNLENTVYGTPFVLAYTNGQHAYMPNTLAYTYNEGSTSYAAGSYEANTSSFDKGTGEKLIAQFGTMLDSLSGVSSGVKVSSYDELIEAVETVSEGSLIKLTGGITFTADLEIDQNVTLDLNGQNINFGNYNITVAEDVTLYCMDSATADFTVNENSDNNNFAKIPKAKITSAGNVAGVPEGTNLIDDGLQYVMIDDGANYSFHCVKLDTYAITLQAKDGNSENPSIYYTSAFAGDEIVQEKVQSYGVALSIVEEPKENNIETHCQKTSYDGFNSGSSTGTLLYNILNTGNIEYVNYRNANTVIYGKAYIKLKENDQYIFGNSADYSLKNVVELVNDSWNGYESSQKDSVVNMLFNYNEIVKSWDIPKIRTHKTDDNSLNILVIGNSHGLDSTRMLYKVFETEGLPEGTENLVIANLYKGGCTMSEHADYLTNNKVKYEYHKVSTESGGKWSQQKDATGLTAMQDEQWDIVILQQANQKSAIATEFNQKQLDAVMNYVKANQISTPEFAWNMLWANPDDYEKFLNPNYCYQDDNGKWVWDAPYAIHYITKSLEESEKFLDDLETNFGDTDGVYQQELMYEAITSNVNKYTDYIGAEKICPAGTAIMKAQMLLRGDDPTDELDQETQLRVYRDYTHLSHYGRLIAAYTWYGTLTGKTKFNTEDIITEIPRHLNVNDDGHYSTYNTSNSYPTLTNNVYTFTDEDVAVLVEAVNWALANPYTVE